MSKLTLNELSASLNDFMDSKQDCQSYSLNTENKTIVGAINEIYGKEIIANAIGEPLDRNDTFTEMSNDINNLLSTFKTNMMNSGVTVESGDKFKQLIDKIQGLTEGEGNKGIQFAKGTWNAPGNITSQKWVTYNITSDMGFIPTYIFLSIPYLSTINEGASFSDSTAQEFRMKDFLVSNINTSSEAPATISNYSHSMRFYFSNISENGFVLNTYSRSPYGEPFTGTCTWYAIGVGEEDTTLRDSLASILENKGIEVTEEDDMASLITKVNNINVSIYPKWYSTGDSYITTCNPMPAARVSGKAIATNNNVYYIGGCKSTTYYSTVYCYDENTNEWSTKADMPTKKGDFYIANVGEKIYVIGGYAGRDNYDRYLYKTENDCYDISTNTWTNKTGLTTAKYNGGATAIGNSIYCIGGQISISSVTDTNECYDTVSDTWTTKTSMSKKLRDHGIVNYNGLIYSFGGSTTTSSGATSQTYCYDPTTNTWTTKASMLSAVNNIDFAVVGDKAYGIGATSGSYGDYKNHCYSFTNDSWEYKTDIPIILQEAAVTSIMNRVYAIGGLGTSSAVTNTALLYVAPTE